jgi:dienelactone hydrolase
VRSAEFLPRRRFLKRSAAMLSVGAALPMSLNGSLDHSRESREEFTIYQERRRWELWGLLGDLPWQHEPGPAKLISTEQHEGYTLERLLLDLNGIEAVSAVLLIPHRRQHPAPGLLFIHWHAGMYGLGKEQLLKGTAAQPAYAPVCAEKGLVTLAIDSWCFGERKHDENGHRGEEDAFKLMLWQGRVLWGMMIFDELRALGYLAARPEVDAGRLGALGMSMGATKAWWLAALDPRLQLCVDVCCLTDYDELIKARSLSEHGVYYYVPSLLKHFNTAQVNELSAPRPRLSVNGRLDKLTPPAGVEKVRDHLLPLYERYGARDDCRIELFDCAHVELPEMRKLILEWLDKYLARKSGGHITPRTA